MAKETTLESRRRVALLYGGRSQERAVSLRSGAAVLRAADELDLDMTGFDIGVVPLAEIPIHRFDCAFIALHGRGGEDGTVQGWLELEGIPYTGSGVLASALSINKMMTKRLWAASGLPTPPAMVVGPESTWSRIVDEVGPVVAVKPNQEGSSIGVHCVDSASGYDQATVDARRYDACVMAERWVTGREYSVALLGARALPAVCVRSAERFYDYHAKYQATNTLYQCPTDLPEHQEREMRDLALEAFLVLGGSGWGRVDLMADESGRYWLLEVNTVPGLTEQSLVPMAARVDGMSFSALVNEILQHLHLEGAVS
ncbi:MAG: D-alanine--D-alanine ligase [Pseudomonadota bacterium]|nr:D-alanine--D-alanine ligase [Pseudomonadota bacterium]